MDAPSEHPAEECRPEELEDVTEVPFAVRDGVGLRSWRRDVASGVLRPVAEKPSLRLTGVLNDAVRMGEPVRLFRERPTPGPVKTSKVSRMVRRKGTDTYFVHTESGSLYELCRVEMNPELAERVGATAELSEAAPGRKPLRGIIWRALERLRRLFGGGKTV